MLSRGMTAIAASPPTGLIGRTSLIRRLTASPRPAVTLLTAPAGCGKTNLLAEWAQVDPRPFAWVQLTPDDDEPLHLLRSIASALETVGSRSTRTLSRQLGALLRDSTEPFVLVLDDAHFVRSR